MLAMPSSPPFAYRYALPLFDISLLLACRHAAAAAILCCRYASMPATPLLRYAVHDEMLLYRFSCCCRCAIARRCADAFSY